MKVIRKHHCGFAFINHDSGYLEKQEIQVLEEIMTTYKKGYYQIDFNDEDVSGICLIFIFHTMINLRLFKMNLRKL